MFKRKLLKFRKSMSGIIVFLLVVGMCSFIPNTAYATRPNVNTKVFAFTDELMQSWGEVSLVDKNVTENGKGSGQKIFFAKDPFTGKSCTWWIAGRVHTNGELSSDPAHSSHMMLYSTRDVKPGQFSTMSKPVAFSDVSAQQKQEFSYLAKGTFPINHYGLSSARAALKTYASSGLTSDEKTLISDSEIFSFDTTNKVLYKTTDKFYLPSCNLKSGAISWGSDDISTADTLTAKDVQKLIPQKYWPGSGSGGDVFWLRSSVPNNGNLQYTFSPEAKGEFNTFSASYGFGCSAVCKVNLETVFFASAASAFYPQDECEPYGKAIPIDFKSGNYGMHLKTIPAKTELADAVLNANSAKSGIFAYENAPKDSYLSACLVDSTDQNIAYTVSIPLNESGKTPNGNVDISKLDTSAIGKGKKLNVVAWIEMQGKHNEVVATYPKTTTIDTGDDLKIDHIPDKPYITSNITISDLTVKSGDKKLTEGKDFKVSYTSNSDIGCAIVRVTGLGEYAGKLAVTKFNITRAIPKLELQSKKAFFTGEVILIDEVKISEVFSVSDFKGNEVTYVYYKDPECTKKLCVFNPADKKISRLLPRDPGTYYVKAMTNDNRFYEKAESNVARLDIVAK